MIYKVTHAGYSCTRGKENININFSPPTIEACLQTAESSSEEKIRDINKFSSVSSAKIYGMESKTEPGHC